MGVDLTTGYNERLFSGGSYHLSRHRWLQDRMRQDLAGVIFDYRALVRDIADFLDVIRVEGIPFPLVPTALSPTVGIIARSKGRR